MAFVVPAQPLNPALVPRRLAARLAPGTQVLRAAEVAAWRAAERLVAEADAQAQAIVRGAQEAFEQERRAGYQAGLEEARLEQAERMIDTVSRTVAYFARVESRMVDLVMESVRKVVADYDETERVLIVVRNALAVLRNQKQMTLRLNPERVEVVRDRMNELLAAYPGIGYLDLVADARLEPDACILESEIGVVEASIDGQLRALQAGFANVLGSRV